MSVNKAVWIAKLLYRRGRLSRRDILSAWAESDEGARPMAVSTFYDNCHLLRDRYGIRLSMRDGFYSIDVRDSREQEFLRGLLGDDEAGPHLAGDKRPVGYMFAAPLSRAMERRTCVSMIYAPFDKPQFSTAFAPYSMRVFRGRGYVVGHSALHGGVRTFALDRVKSVEPTPYPYPKAPPFDAREYFSGSFGIYGGHHSPQHVVVEADTRNAAFLRTLPLHASQRETAAGGRGVYTCRFELDVNVTDDLVHELLYYGPGVRVVEPRPLRDRMLAAARATLRAYGEADK